MGSNNMLIGLLSVGGKLPLNSTVSVTKLALGNVVIGSQLILFTIVLF